MTTLPDHIRALREALAAARACIFPELALYAMESLDEYVDAAMEDEMRNAALTNTGA